MCECMILGRVCEAIYGARVCVCVKEGSGRYGA